VASILYTGKKASNVCAFQVLGTAFKEKLKEVGRTVLKSRAIALNIPSANVLMADNSSS